MQIHNEVYLYLSELLIQRIDTLKITVKLKYTQKQSISGLIIILTYLFDDLSIYTIYGSIFKCWRENSTIRLKE